MRVLITGGAGFIGSHLADAALERGHHVTVLDNLSTGRIDRLPGEVYFLHASITDQGALRRGVEEARPEVIYHLAAQIDVRASVADPAADAAVNVLGAINVATAAHAVGARVVFAGTGGALYGQHAPIPSPEGLAPEPEAPYGAAKHCAENYLALFNRLHGASHAGLRLGNVYGPRQDPAGEAGVVSIFAGAIHRGDNPTIFGDGTQTRDYIYVGDVVDAFLIAGHAPRGGVWNIGTGIETSVNDLVSHLGKSAGRGIDPDYAPARPGELDRSCLDVSRAENDLDFTPDTPLADGIDHVYRWVQAGEPDRGHR